MIAVNEVHISPPGGPKEHRVARCLPHKGMCRFVIIAKVSLSLDNSPCQHSSRRLADQQLPQQRPCDPAWIAIEKLHLQPGHSTNWGHAPPIRARKKIVDLQF